MATLPSPFKTAALVLAGGRARRMNGADKPLMRLHGKPLIAHVIPALSAPGRPVAISANGDLARFALFGLPVLQDADESHSGPLAGLLAGLVWARTQGCTHLLSAPADCPFLPPDLSEKLQAAQAPDVIRYARHRARAHPTIALWPLSVETAIRQALAAGERRLMGFVEAQGAQAVDWPDHAGEPFLNINTPEDLENAQRMPRMRHALP